MANFIDSNLILRYLLDDPGAEKTEKLLKGNEKFILTDVTVAEIIWVLDSFYKWEKRKIMDAMTGLIYVESIISDKELFLTTFKLYKNYNIDYIDAYLAASLIRDGKGVVYSFDRDFDKIPEIKRVEPK